MGFEDGETVTLTGRAPLTATVMVAEFAGHAPAAGTE
jgi:hypothetical protein